MDTVTTSFPERDAQLDWWRGATIYQIYPRSFQDSNGDGVGDLAGIVERIPYIASLGVDAIWISPFFASPMKDFGYDVSDYRAVDPMFGSLEDFDRVIKIAHSHGVKVIIDLVLSHTSDAHDWFAQSRISRSASKADWYVWANPKPDGTPPNNWLSIFGGSAWQWDGRREQYYLHNFLNSQPDLNFHNDEVQDALLDVATFWLERGVDGFRLDTINFYFHDAQLRDNPPLPIEQRNSSIAPSINPYNHQEHLYDKNQPENLAFLRRLRSLLDTYGAIAVGEVGDAQSGLEILGQYTAGNKLMQMCYAFDLLSKDQPTAERIAHVLEKVAAVAADGWACWAFSNHDVQRHATRWNLTPKAQRLFITLMMCMRGSVCLYQGEELGLTEAELAFEDLQDPYGIEFWPEFAGRDGCRTPMVWHHDNRNGGFSDGKPWLPVAAEHLAFSVSQQEDDQHSMLNFYRQVIRFRQRYKALTTGTLFDIKVEGNVLSFYRQTDDQTLFCAFNTGETGASVTLPSGTWEQIGSQLGSVEVSAEAAAELGPWQTCLRIRQ